MTGAERFGRILDAEMTRRGMGNPELERLVGATNGRAWNWRNGNHLPTLENARRLADVLGNEYLYRSVMATRTKTCLIEGCGATFVDASRRTNGRYCSSRCRLLADARMRRRTQGQAVRFANSRLATYTRTIAAFCRECEPEGTCRDSTCVIQAAGISPLRLSRRAIA